MQRIQLSGDSFSCFLTLPIEIKASPISSNLVISTDTATWTLDNQRILANGIDCSPVRMQKSYLDKAYQERYEKALAAPGGRR